MGSDRIQEGHLAEALPRQTKFAPTPLILRTGDYGFGRGILPAYLVTGSCQRLTLLRECPPAFGLPLDFASQSKSLAGSCWLGLGESPLIGLLYGWGGFYLQKVLLASMGYARAAITFIVTT